MTPKQDQITAPIGTATAGYLEFARGGSRITLHAHEEVAELYRARFEGVAPMAFAHDGRITIEYPRLLPTEWLRPNRRAAEITLNQSLSWTLVYGGGVPGLRADLRRLTRPAGSPARAHISGGASKLTFDGQRLGAVGGETQLARPIAEHDGGDA